jgi:membrane protein implicated in regulation of membrane protease activity
MPDRKAGKGGEGMPWWVWLIVAVVIGIIEVSTFTFVLLWIAIAALLTTFLTGIVPDIWLQLLIFAITSTILFIVTRPLARKWKGQKRYTNQIDSMTRQVGIVVKGAKVGELATIKVNGEAWSAHCSRELLEGQQVVVTEAASTVLKVEPMERKMNS